MVLWAWAQFDQSVAVVHSMTHAAYPQLFSPFFSYPSLALALTTVLDITNKTMLSPHKVDLLTDLTPFPAKEFYATAAISFQQVSRRGYKITRLQHPACCPNDSYRLLTQGEQDKIFQLRTGHHRLNHHLHTEFGIGQTGQCPCKMDR